MSPVRKTNHNMLYLAVIALSIAFAGVSARAQQFSFASIDVPGATASSAHGINSSGNIIGRFRDAFNQGHGFLLTGFPGSPTFQTIDFPANQAPGGVQVTAPGGINNNGDIVGTVIDGNGNLHGFLLTGFPDTPTYYLIDFPAAQSPTGQVLLTVAHSLNNNGDIVGAFLDGSGTFHGFKLTGFPGSPAFSIVDFPGAAFTNAFGINDDGAIVGGYTPNTRMRSPVFGQAFLLVGTTFTTLSPPAGNNGATGINNSYDIVGDFTGGRGSAGQGYLLVGTSFTVISFPHSKTTASFGIGPTGEIVGAYLSTDGVEHGFLATPSGP